MQKRRKKIPYRRILAMVWPSMKPSWKFLPLFFIGAFISGAFTVSEPYLYGSIIDTVLGAVGQGLALQEGFSQVLPFLIIWGGVVIGQTSLAAIYAYYSWYVSHRVSGGFIQALYAKLLELDIARFRSQRSGSMFRRMDNAWDGLWHIQYNITSTFLSAGMQLVLSFMVGFYVNWQLAVISLIPMPIVIGLGILNLRANAEQQDKVSKFWEKIYGRVGDVFANIASIKNFVLERKEIQKFAQLYRQALHNQMGVSRRWSLVETGYGSTFILGRLVIFIMGSYLVLQGQTTVGTLVMFLGFASFLFSSVSQLVNSFPEISRAFSNLNRVLDDWEKIPLIQDPKDPIRLKNVRGQVEFSNLSFGYLKGAPILCNVSFTIPDGQTYAIVGASGSGKSTLTQLLLRFYDPWDGGIKIDGVDLRDLSVDHLRKNVGLVMQENLLFHDSILQNIRLAKPNAKEEEVIEAAKRAQAHEFISKLKKGYHTVVGERGVKLSGGEKQRIALARVLLANPPILVLDEATSALDSKTEHLLQGALKEVMKGRTSLVIAHRLSTIMEADKILVMDKGRIVAKGTHEKLLESNPLYRQYWEIQAGSYEKKSSFQSETPQVE
ncbi:MAG: ABC transporter ATP-binding protein [Patescibacteria group bacterium]|jgi:ATP-binding cassette subfamily B protein